MYFQWTCQGTNLPWATNCVLVLTNAQPDLIGTQYSLIASNAFGVATNGPIILNESPSELYVSASATAGLVDENITITATTIGQGPFSFQWQFDGTNLVGETNLTLALDSLQLSEAGSYSIISSNNFGVVSNAVTITVTPTVITELPTNQIALIDGEASFSIGVEAFIPLSYQWQFDGTDIDGATTNSLSLTNLQYSQQGTYSVIYSNSFEMVTNTLVLTIAPTIITNSLGNQVAFINGGDLLNIGVEALIPVNYQWQFDGTNIDGATTNSLSLSNLQYAQQGTYSVIYSDAFETVTNNSVLSVGTVAAWGDMGQQTVAPGLTNIIAIAAGDFHGLALRADGTVVGWGQGPAAISPQGLSNVISVSAGYLSSLALKSDGTVVAWGENTRGENNVPQGLSNVVAIAAGDFHNLALTSAGMVVAWGDNTSGEINVPPSLTNVVAIAADQFTSMALEANGTVFAWGDNEYGESSVPGNLSDAIQIASGGDHSLALQSTGTIVGWGYNIDGELNPPADLTNVFSIAAGFGYSGALTTLGTVQIWGNGANVPTGLSNVVMYRAKSGNNLALIGNGPPTTQAVLSNLGVTPNGFSTSVLSESGHTYALEYANDLSGSNWVAFPLVAGTSQSITLADTNVITSQRFYRVQKW